jgi:hypothetical protein
VGRQGDEDVPVPDVRLHPVERVVFLPEVRHLLHVRRADQAAVQSVGPGVVRALNAAGELARGVGAQPGAAMAADVVERLHGAGRAARDDQALAEHLSNEELTRRLDLFEPPGANPVPREQPIHLDPEAGFVDVEHGRQRGRAVRHDIARLDGDVSVGHGNTEVRSQKSEYRS